MMNSVYLVDDDPFILETMVDEMPWKETGFEICGTSPFPLDAIDEIMELRPQLVVCDLKMPGMDGTALMKVLKRKGLDSEFLMVSAFESFHGACNFYRMDGFDYLLKPVDLVKSQITLEKISRKLLKKNGCKDFRISVRDGKGVIDDIMDYIEEHFNKKITLDVLSQEFHLNPNYISTLFPKNYKINFSVFLTSVRMQEASRLIKYTEQPLSNIAAECGFGSYVHFRSVFNNYYHVSPREYALTHRGKDNRYEPETINEC